MSRLIALIAFMFQLTACGMPDVSIGLDIPRTVPSGGQFQFQATVANNGNSPVSFNSIDFDAMTLSGFSFVSSNPVANALDDMPLDGKRLSLNKLIEPNERLTVSVVLRAGKPGKYRSDLAICVDAEVFCDYNKIDIEITP